MKELGNIFFQRLILKLFDTKPDLTTWGVHMSDDQMQHQERAQQVHELVARERLAAKLQSLCYFVIHIHVCFRIWPLQCSRMT